MNNYKIAIIGGGPSGMIAAIKAAQELEGGEDIVLIEKNANGDIVLIDVKPSIINKISSEYSVKIKNKLDKNLEKGIKIPLIAFTGIKIFSGYGVKVNFKMLEVNKVNSEIRNDFISQGINQTLHRNFIDITVKINLMLPLKTKEICINKTILLNESILVGKIPQVYLQK